MNTPSSIGIVADDLTGGSAIAGEIARIGTRVHVARFDYAGPIGNSSIVLETASRYIESAESARRVREATRRLQNHHFAVIMKKIDSTLKGNVATELAVFCQETTGTVLITPACPDVGLTLRGGRQRVGNSAGVDVEQLLGGVLSAKPALLPIAVVNQGRAEIFEWLGRNRSAVVLADAITQEDLDAIALGGRDAGITAFAGTYGLGAALQRAVDGPFSSPRTTPPARRMVVLIGSASPTTVKQIELLVDAGAAEVTINVQEVLAGDADRELSRIRSLVESASAAVIVVHTGAPSNSRFVKEQQTRAGWNERDLAIHLVPPLAEAVRAAPSAALFFVGGETTGALFDHFGWHELVVVDESSPAVPIAQGAFGDHPFVLTKPGAFGVPVVLVEAARHLVSGWNPKAAANQLTTRTSSATLTGA